MTDLLSKILDWPVIVQGAVGSALFAAVLYLGQKIFLVLPKLVSRLSAGRRRSLLNTQLIKLHAYRQSDLAGQAAYGSALMYRAMRDLIKGLIWLTLGLLSAGFVGAWSFVGYVGCLYYLFFALSVVKPFDFDDASIEEQIKDIENKLSQLQGQSSDA